MKRFHRRTCIAAVAFFAGTGSAGAQLPAGVERNPANARIVVDDLDRFAEAHRRLLAVRDTLAFLDSTYLGNGTAGLATYARMYDVDASSLAEALVRSPETSAERRTKGRSPCAPWACE